jgi:lactoylglutathione lyase
VNLTFSHVGICVSDLERSLRFYCEGLGFEPAQAHTVGREFGQLMEVDDVVLQSRFVYRDGVSLELLHFDSPGHSGGSERRPMNQLGITHLSLRVDDLDHVARVIESLGGRVVTSTRTTLGPSDNPLDFVYCTDPDGVRIELMRLPD